MSTFTLQLRKSDWTGLFDTFNNHVNSLNINVPHVKDGSCNIPAIGKNG